MLDGADASDVDTFADQVLRAVTLETAWTPDRDPSASLDVSSPATVPTPKIACVGSETVEMGRITGLPLEPLSDQYGFDRDTPLDRRYIEAFLIERRGAIRGSVLEVQDDTYTARIGGDRVSGSAVVDIDESNQRATLIADLEQPGSLPAATYDCIILTQTLHLLRRPGTCLENCYCALRQAGTLLATAPSVSRVSPTHPDGDYWRFTPAGIAELFARNWEGESSVHAFGNLRSCVGFLLGEVVEDLGDTILDHHDPRFPLTVAVEAHKT